MSSMHKIPDDVIEQHIENFPHIKTYEKCQKDAFQAGFYTIITTSATVFVGQHLLQKWLPMTAKMYIVTPMLVGIFAGYGVGYYKTRQCNKMWLAMEGKHTALTELNEG